MCRHHLSLILTLYLSFLTSWLVFLLACAHLWFSSFRGSFITCFLWPSPLKSLWVPASPQYPGQTGSSVKSHRWYSRMGPDPGSMCDLGLPCRMNGRTSHGGTVAELSGLSGQHHGLRVSVTRDQRSMVLLFSWWKGTHEFLQATDYTCSLHKQTSNFALRWKWLWTNKLGESLKPGSHLNTIWAQVVKVLPAMAFVIYKIKTKPEIKEFQLEAISCLQSPILV